MPDPEGRAPAFYDHETEEPRATGRRRRQVADWGVGEDAFDRLPSRRFGRRGEERRHVARHEDFTSRDFDRDDVPARSHRFARGEDDAIGAPHREVSADRRAPRDEAVADWLRGAGPRGDAADGVAGPAPPADDARADEDGEAELSVPPDEGPRRTIVLGGAVEGELPPRADDPRPRRTIVIGGHPDGLPVVRQRRPAPTAMERVGTR